MAVSKKIQNKIAELYKKKRLSGMQIAESLKLSNSVVHYWLKKQDIKKRTISEAITNINITKFNKKPFSLKDNFSKIDSELKIAGTMLYWGEGAKTGSTVKFANSDPEMIVLFLNFLRKICGISEKRLRVLIHMYPDHDEKKLKNFWSKTTGVSLSRFYKSYIHQGRVGTYKTKSKYGTLAVNYSDKRLLKILLEWIEQYKKILA